MLAYSPQSSQCCPNTAETTLHKKITGAMLAQTTYRSRHRKCSVKKCVLKNFAIFTGKNMYWSLSLIKLQAFSPETLLERLQRRCFPVNNAKLLTAPILKNICERLLLYIVIFSQKNNHIRCLNLREPKLHKKIARVMLPHSPQRTLHRKIMYNFVWIYLGKPCIRKYLWNVGPWLKYSIYEEDNLPRQCCVNHAGTALHRNIV